MENLKQENYLIDYMIDNIKRNAEIDIYILLTFKEIKKTKYKDIYYFKTEDGKKGYFNDKYIGDILEKEFKKKFEFDKVGKIVFNPISGKYHYLGQKKGKKIYKLTLEK